MALEVEQVPIDTIAPSPWNVRVGEGRWRAAKLLGLDTVNDEGTE